MGEPAPASVVAALPLGAPGYCCTFSHSGLLLATASSDVYDGAVRVWDAQRPGACLWVLGNTGQFVGCCSFSPDDRLLAVALDADVAIWDWRSGARVRTMQGHRDTVYGCSFSPDGRLLASAADSGNARIWDALTGACLCATPAADYLGFLSAALSGAQIWRLAKDTCIMAAGDPGSCAWIRDCAVSADGRLLAVPSFRHAVTVFEIPSSGGCLCRLQGHQDHVAGSAFSPDGTLLATWSAAELSARLWVARTGVCLRTLQGHAKALWGCAFSPDGLLLATASLDHTARIWDIARPELKILLLVLGSRRRRQTLPAEVWEHLVFNAYLSRGPTT